MLNSLDRDTCECWRANLTLVLATASLSRTASALSMFHSVNNIMRKNHLLKALRKSRMWQQNDNGQHSYHILYSLTYSRAARMTEKIEGAAVRKATQFPTCQMVFSLICCHTFQSYQLYFSVEYIKYLGDLYYILCQTRLQGFSFPELFVASLVFWRRICLLSAFGAEELLNSA